ncbi:hypothetical protein C8D88_10432 [Lentzea atacamensis]|uniref:Uncharacterized protein n=1 Tax=Lentzea atacamensis TaxID=531938 RepID=A0A316HZW3_9PSEU|nr:hypothetical protein C8D88_10432 [Lentzea atacamensis]
MGATTGSSASATSAGSSPLVGSSVIAMRNSVRNLSRGSAISVTRSMTASVPCRSHHSSASRDSSRNASLLPKWE